MPTSPFKPLAVLAEKVFWTYVQSVLALLAIGDSLAVGGLNEKLAIAALPAAMTVLANGLPVSLNDVTPALDLAYRVVRSFATSFLGFLLAVPVFSLDPSVLESAYGAGLVAVIAVFKGAVASKLIGDDSPATLPA